MCENNFPILISINIFNLHRQSQKAFEQYKPTNLIQVYRFQTKTFNI